MTFIIIFSLMMITIAVLNGCTQFDTHDSDHRDIRFTVTPTPDGGCAVYFEGSNKMDVRDDTFEFDQP